MTVVGVNNHLADQNRDAAVTLSPGHRAQTDSSWWMSAKQKRSSLHCICKAMTDQSVFMADIQYEGHLNTPEVAGLSP